MKPVSRRRICTASIAAFVLAGLVPAKAQTIWSGGGGDDLWSTPSNWNPGGLPDAASDLLFPAPVPAGMGTITLGAGSLANSLSFSSTYLLTGGNLMLTSGAISVDMGARATLSTLLDGTAGLSKTGRGTLLLTNPANSYTGTTTISGGAVVITNPSALGTDDSAVVVSGNISRTVGGGQLILDGGTAGMTFSRDLAVNGGGPGGDNYAVRSIGNNTISGDITAASSALTRVASSFGTLNLTGKVTVGGSGLVFGGSAHTFVTGQITGSGPIYRASSGSGTGTLVLANDSNNFTGIVNVDAGSVRVASAGALGTSTAVNAIEFNGGILEIRTDVASGFNGTKGVTVETSGSDNGVLFVDRAIGGSGLNQTATFKDLDQNNRNFAIRGRNGYSVIFNDSADADTFAVTDVTETKSFTNDTNGTVTLAGDININSSTARTYTMQGAGSTVVTGSIMGNGGGAHALVKGGTGTLTIQGTSSTYTGATSINGGTLSIRGFGALGANPATSTTVINIGSTTTAGTLNYIGDGETTARTINLAGTTGGAIINANQPASATTPLVLTSAFTATGAGTKTVTLGGSNTLDNEIQGAIVQNSGANLTNLTKTGPGTWVLSGANSYTGTTTITDGTLKLRGSGSIASTSGLSFSTTSGMEGGIGTFEYLGTAEGSSQTLGNLTLNSNAATIKVTRPGDATGATVLTLGTAATLSRTNGASVNFVVDAGSGANGSDAKIVLSGITANGFLNPGAYFNGSSFASYSGTGASGFVEALAYTAEQTNVLTAGEHNLINANTTAAAPATAVRSLKLSGDTALTLSGGTLILNHGSGTSGGILADAGISEISGGTGISVGGGGELVVRVNGANDHLTIKSALTNGTTGGFTKTGAGTLIVTNSANALSGNVRIIEGTVRLANGAKLGTGVMAIRNGTFDVGGVPALTYSQLLGGGRLTNSGAADTVFTFGDTNAIIFSGVIEDGATNKISIVKNGTGNQTMSGLSTYTGSTRINAGTVIANTLGNIGSPSSIGRGAATDDASNAASLVFGGGGLQYNGAASISTDRLFTLAGNGTLDASGVNNTTLIYSNTGTVAFSGAGARTLTLQGSSTGDNEIKLRLVNNPNAGEVLNVTKSGAGLWILGNETNSYTGTTTITQGALAAVDGQSLPSASPLVFNATGTNNAVLQTSGAFTRSLGTGAGQVSWNGTNSGGFAASTGKLTVAIGGLSSPTQLTWGADGFTGGNLIFGSSTALFDTEFVNSINLGDAIRIVQVDDNNNTLLDFATLSGVLSGTGSLNKTGNAALLLTGENTFTGNTSISAGTLVVQSLGGGSASTSSLGAASGVLSIGNSTTTGTLSYVGTGETSSRTIRLTGTTGGAIIESNGTGPLVLTDIINSGAGVKTLTLQGLNTDLNEVTANLADNGGALNVTASQAGVWILSGNNSHTGTTNVTGQVALGLGSNTAAGAGTLSIDNSTVFAARGDRTLANAITLRGNRTSYFIGDYSLTFEGAAQIGTDTGDSTINNNLVAGKTLTLTGTLRNADLTASRQATFNGSGTTVVTGQILDSTADQATRITYSGTGSLTLGGTSANLYTGTTTVSSGTLILAKQLTPVGSGTLSLNGGALQATVDLAGTNKLANAVTVGGAATVSGGNDIEFGGTFTNSGGNRSLTNSLDAGRTLTLSGTVNLSNDATSRTLTFGGAGTTLITGRIVNGSTSTASGLTINAPLGTVTLLNTGAANAYGGTTTLSDGTLKLGAAQQLPNGAAAGNLVFNPATGTTAVLELSGFNETVNGLSSTGAGASIINNAAASGVTFTVGDNGGEGVFAGDVTKTGGAISLNKIGMGAITFSGADLSGLSGGEIAVSAGVLNLAGSSSTAITPAALTVAGGATLSLGNGAGQIMNLGSGLLSLGSATGTTFLNLELGSTSAYDRILTTGVATTTGNIGLNLTALSGFGAGTYNLLQAGSGLNTGNWSLNAVPGGFSYSFNTSDTLVQLVASAVTGDAFWHGDISGSWSAITGGGSNTNWATTADGAVDRTAGPGADSTVHFSTANATGPVINTTLDTDFRINGLKFISSSSGVTSISIAPGTPQGSLTIAPSASAAGIDVAGNVGAVTISAPLVLGADQTWNVAGTGTNGSSLTVSGGLSGSGIFTKTGAGTATISAPATTDYTATGAVVNGGTLELTHVSALGGVANTPNSGATVSVNAGGTFYYNGAQGTVPNALNLNGGTLASGGASQTYSGNIALSSNSTVSLQDLGTSTATARTITLSGNIAGTGKMIVDSVPTATGGNQYMGILVLSQANPDWSGGVQLQRGTLDLRDQAALGTGTLSTSLGRVLFKGANGTTWAFANPVALDAAEGNAVVELQADNQGTTSVFTMEFTEAVTLGGSGAAPFLRLHHADALSALRVSGGIVLKANGSIHTSGGGTANYQPIVISSNGISESGGSYRLLINGDTAWGSNNYQTIRIDASGSYTGGTTLQAGRLVLGVKDALGSGALTLNGGTLQAGVDLTASGSGPVANNIVLNGTSTVDGANSLTLAGTVTNNGASRTWTNNLASSATLTIDGNVFLSEDVAVARTLTFGGSGSTIVNGVISNANGAPGSASAIAKTGTGTVTLNAANTYTQDTRIDQGTLAFGVNQTMTGALVFGTANTTTSAGTLDLTNANASFGSLVARTNSSTNINTVNIGVGKTLTINGNVTIGSDAAASTITMFTATGGGAIVVNAPAANAFFNVGGVTSAASVGNRAIADLSGLSSLTVNLNTTNGVFRVNPSNSNNVASRYSVLTLPSTGAGTTTITASQLAIGDSGQLGGSNQLNAVRLGSGVNTFNVNAVNIGTGSRDYGSLSFNGTSGSIVVRDAAGTGRAALNIGTGNASTGVGGDGNTFDVAGHDADLLLGAVAIGTQNRGVAHINTFSFDQGTLDMTSLVMSTRTAGTTNGGGLPRLTTSTVNLGGGTVAIQNGILTMASAAGTYGTSEQAPVMNATINVSGGNVTIGNTAGTSINMASYTATGGTGGGSANATLNLTGGVTTLSGNISKISGSASANATVNLDGGTLDMSGKAIGGVNTVALNAKSGTLMNLGELNDGGAFTKTGPGTLLLDGTNTYTGPTIVSEGTLAIGVEASVSGTTEVTVGGGANAATLMVHGALGNNATVTVKDLATVLGHGAINGSLTIESGGTVTPGNSVGSGVGELFVSNGFTLQAGAHLKLDITGTTPASGYDQLAVTDGNITLAGDLAGSLLSFTPTNFADIFYVILNNGTGTTTGTLGGVGDGGYLNIGGQDFRLSLTSDFNGAGFQIGGTGNDVALMAVPEPASAAMLAGGIGMLLGMRRFRRRGV